MTVSPYASDLTEAEWALLQPLLTRTHPAGRKQAYSLRRIVDAVFYLVTGRSGPGLHRDADLVQQVLILAQQFGYASQREDVGDRRPAQAA